MAAKKMNRRSVTDDEASEALLNSMLERSDEIEVPDDPFLDEDGDQRVLPTYEELSLLLDGPSSQALPMREILRRNLRVTLRAIEMAEIAYHANPRQGTATALTQMQNIARDTIKAIEDRQDPEILCNEIFDIILKPLIMDFVKTLTSEAEKKRTAIMTYTPPENSGMVSHEIKDLLNGVSQGCDEAVDNARRRLADLLGTKNK